MKEIKQGEHVILTMYNPKTKSADKHDALVIGTERAEEGKPQPLHLAFVHPDRMNGMMSVDWRDSLENLLSVPHESAVGNQSFYYNEADNQDDVIASRDEHIQKLLALLAEKQASLPSAADLDAVAADEKAREQTSGDSAQV